MKLHSLFVLLLAVLSLSSLVGCSTLGHSFEIRSTTDKFSDPEQPVGFVGFNNKLTNKSSRGGTHIDYRGIYLDPYVTKDRKSGEIVTTGFFFSYLAFEPSDGFNPLTEIVFITDDGGRVELPCGAKGTEYDIGSFNTITGGYNSSYKESAVCQVSVDDLIKLADSGTLEAKLTGGNRSLTLEKKHIRGAFLVNLKSFVNSQLRAVTENNK